MWKFSKKIDPLQKIVGDSSSIPHDYIFFFYFYFNLDTLHKFSAYVTGRE